MTTLATCWKVTRQDAAVYAFTDHDHDLTVGGVTYKSAIGYAPSAIDRGIDLAIDNQVLTGIINGTDITEADLRSGKWSGALVEIIEVDWTTETQARVFLKGFLGEVALEGEQYSTEMRSLESELAKPLGRSVTLRCDAELGDSRCGYSLSAVSVTVTTGGGNLSFVDTSLTQADGAFNNGKITWTSGGNAGLTYDVKRYVAATDTVELYEPTIAEIQVGDEGNLFLGCDRTLETCRDTFSNVDNFRGFPYLPGVSDLVSGNTQ